jgi:hypothetical protein
MFWKALTRMGAAMTTDRAWASQFLNVVEPIFQRDTCADVIGVFAKMARTLEGEVPEAADFG